MSLLSQIERRFRRIAIPNVTTLIVAGQACLWVASKLPQGIAIERVMLIPSRVLQGEAWRLFTFLFTPPLNLGPLFAIFYFLLLHNFGSTLERHWGTFRFNLFLAIGWFANITAAFVASAIMGNFDADVSFVSRFAAVLTPNTFLYSSLFLAFARLYPDYVLNLFFVLPIRIKWLALVEWVVYGYIVLTGTWMERLLVIATVANYLLFFGSEHWRDLKQGQRRRSFQARASKAAVAPVHQCRICETNSNDSPRTAFRYCSKCEGQACYCPNHIRDHEHVTAETKAT